VRPEWLTRLDEAWKQKMGDMEMIYDGNCGFCKRSMDGLWLSMAFDRFDCAISGVARLQS
jgi:hypothetical protein